MDKKLTKVQKDKVKDILFPIADTELIKAFRESDEKRKVKLASDPNNGKLGWWHVDGIRHNAVVRAYSATEAVEKAEKEGAVQDWEVPSARYIGVELPDVVSL